VIGGHQQQPPPPRRVAVSGPRRDRDRGWSARAGAEDLHAQPQLGQVYVRSLVRDQLRLSLGVLAVLAVVLGGLPAAFALVPGLRTAEVLGVRLAWLLLGVVAYPVLVGAAWFHVRHAERVERDFTDLLNGPTPAASSPPIAEPGSASPADGLPTPLPGKAVDPEAPHPGPHPGADRRTNRQPDAEADTTAEADAAADPHAEPG
jgi:hypothetical protein